METDSQDSEEKPIPDKLNSNVKDNINSESQLNTEESNFIKPETVEPTKTGETFKINLPMVMKHSNCLNFIVVAFCTVLETLFLQKKYPNSLVI